MKKKTFHSETAYIAGLFFIALSVALIQKSNFGVSMVVAPAYIIHLYTGISFGTAEYLLQGLIILIMIGILRKFRISYILSFVTAVIYGFILDGLIYIVGYIPSEELWQRIVLFIIGEQFCCMGVATVFRTYLPPESYEMIVKELSEHFGWNMGRCKWSYDLISCGVSIIMSFIFFGKWRFDIVGVGTVVCAAVNGYFIGRYSKLLDKLFNFKDALPWRTFFTGEK